MVHPEAARQQITLRLDALRGRTFAELLTLPSHKIESVRFGDSEWSVTTYRDVEQDAIRIVVQIGPPQMKFLLLNVQADGFRLSSAGTISALTRAELYEFM